MTTNHREILPAVVSPSAFIMCLVFHLAIAGFILLQKGVLMGKEHDVGACVNYEDDKYPNLIGKRFGKLIVLHVYHKKDGRNSRLIMVCRCDCGKEVHRRYDSTIGFNSSSCGCASHHLAHTRLYYVWKDIKNRCYSKRVDAYKWYGARGIGMCDEWRNDPVAFIEWCKNNGYKPGLQIDRRDNNKGYSPENCRFVTRTENMRNTSAVRMLTFRGETKPMSEWCEILGISYSCVVGRLAKGMSVEEAFTAPINKSQQRKWERDTNGRAHGKTIAYEGKELTCLEWARLKGMSWYTIYNRLRLGWPSERIFSEPERRRAKNAK